MKYYISGDTHGNFTRFRNLDEYKDNTTPVGVIVLGDCAVNWTLNPEQDRGLKRQLTYKFPNFCWFLLRGNHDARPEDVKGMKKVWCHHTQGYMWHEDAYPNIYYFMDGGIYYINGFKCLAIGGAYSVDKFYRLARGGIWHANEQLTEIERHTILEKIKGENFDFVFTHTAPICWEPTDLFLNGLDQSTVDKTTELWLDKVRQSINYKIWLFGHYHTNRLERPGVQLMYEYIEDMGHIWARWTNPEVLQEEWYLPKSPMYYAAND